MTAAMQSPSMMPRLDGLSEAEAAARLARGEGNSVSYSTSRSFGRIVFENAFTPLNIVLYAIGLVLVVLGAPGDALMTAGLVFANVIVGVVQEERARRQLDRIALLAHPTATVIREGRERVIDPAQVVRGDLLVARAGDQILVDGRAVEVSSFSLDESLLTGESDLVAKKAGDPVHSGSFCVSGSGVYEATAVGDASLAQQLTRSARRFRNPKTPLQREIAFVTWGMAVLMIGLGWMVFDAYGDITPELPLVETVRWAAVIAALVPQGLSFMVTFNYALAAVRMSRKGALVQRMNAVESTSHVDVLCVDKTGTLTTNQLRLESAQPLGIEDEELHRLLGIFVASVASANHTTEAIAAAYPGEPRRVRAEAVFSSARKWSALLFDDPELSGIYVLGAPEMMAPALTPDADPQEQVREQAARGLRVLLFARGPKPRALFGEDGEPRLPPALTPLGLICLSDELRPEAAETIARLGETGVALKVISGDSPETVAALAVQVGLPPDIKATAGTDLAQQDDAQLAQTALDCTIFGRITPDQKARLVNALRGRGHYVAMTGDGINDVPALKQANLAVAMRSGSQMTRNVADIVLMNDSFAVLPAAFLEGQRILHAMQDIIRLFLVRTFSMALVILIAALTVEEFPITPKHGALLALLTVGIPTVALAAWARPSATPRHILPSTAAFVLPAAVSIAAVNSLVYFFFLGSTGDVLVARSALTTTAVLCGLVAILFLQPPTPAWTGGRPLYGDVKPVLLALAMLALFIATLAWAPARDFYQIELLSVPEYAVITMLVFGWGTALRAFWRADLPREIGGLMQRMRRRLSPVPAGPQDA